MNSLLLWICRNARRYMNSLFFWGSTWQFSRLAFPNILQCKKVLLWESRWQFSSLVNICCSRFSSFLFSLNCKWLHLVSPLFEQTEIASDRNHWQHKQQNSNSWKYNRFLHMAWLYIVQTLTPQIMAWLYSVQTLTPQIIAAHHIAGRDQSLRLTSMLSYKIWHLPTKTMGVSHKLSKWNKYWEK